MLDKLLGKDKEKSELDEFGNVVDSEHSSRNEDLNKSDFDDILREEKELSAKSKKGKKAKKTGQATLIDDEGE